MSDLVYLLECKPYDPVAGTTKNVYFAKGLATEGDLDPNNPYMLRLQEPLVHEVSIFEDNIPGGTNISLGAAVINNTDGRLDYLVDYSWDGRSVVVKRGLRGDPLANFVTEFSGSAMEIAATQNQLTLTLRDNSFKLAKPIQQNKYAGSGGAEGGLDLKDRRKPLLFGKARNAPPILVDNILLTYQIHDGAITSVESVYDQGNPLTFQANFTTYAALIAADISPGKYATSLETGFIRLGAPPVGVPVMDAHGQYSTSTTIADLAKSILTGRLGLTTGDLNVPSFTECAADASQAYEGVYFPEPEFQMDELLETFAASINGFWYVNRQGLITFRQFKFRTPVGSIREEDLLQLGKAASPVPLYRVTVNYAKNPFVQSSDDFTIPKQTFNGYLSKRYVYVDGTPASVSNVAQFKVFLNDTQINDLGKVQFRVTSGESWLTIDSSGNISLGANPGTNAPFTATLRANLGEFFIDEIITVKWDTVAPFNNWTLNISGDRFYIDDNGLPVPSTQVLTLSNVSVNGGTLSSYSAVDNLGNPVTITGGNTISISSLVDSPLVFWVDVTATSSTGMVDKRKIIVQRGNDGLAQGLLGALSAANAAITVYFQAAAPSSPTVDDLWYDTDDANKVYRWTGSTWAAISDTRIIDALTQAAGAQATADGKIKTFFGESTPTATAIGDLWYKGSTKTLYRWSGTDWSTQVGSYGATIGTNLYDSTLALLLDAAVKNSAITIGPDGTLIGAGGGQVTAYGLDIDPYGGENLVQNGWLIDPALSLWDPTTGNGVWNVATAADPVPTFLRFSSTGTSYALRSNNAQGFPVNGGETLYWSIWLRNTLGDDNSARINVRFRWWDAAGTQTFSAGIAVKPLVANAWSLKTFSIAVPSNAVRGSIELYGLVGVALNTVDLGGIRVARSEYGATLGATAGTNLFDSTLSLMLDNAIKNSAISISSAGVLSGAGGGSVTISGLGFTGALDATKNVITYSATAPSSPVNGDIWVDTTTSSYIVKVRVSGAWQTSATYGAQTGVNLYDTLLTALNDAAIKNTAITISSSGTLSGAGGGSVTITGLGYLGDLFATQTGQAQNLLRDDLFGTAWTLHANFSSIVPTAASGYAAGSQPKALQVQVSSSATRDASIAGTAITPDKRYYFAARVSRGTTASGTVRLMASWTTSAGAAVGSDVFVDVPATALTAGAPPKEFIWSAVSPATAAFVTFTVRTLVGGTTGNTFRVEAPRIADVGSNYSLNGPTSGSGNYNFDGTPDAGDLPKDFNYTLSINNTESSNSTIQWSYLVLEGSVNGFTASSGAQTLTNGSLGTFTLSTLETSDAKIRMTANLGGSTATIDLTLTKITLDPPPGSGGTPITQDSGFTSILSPWTTFVAITATGLQIQVPTGKTSVQCTVLLSPRWSVRTQQSLGPWNIEYKLQRENTPGGGTWTDVGSVQNSSPDPYIEVKEVFIDDTPDVRYTTHSGTMSATINDTGRTAGVTYSYRIVARISSGSTTGNTSGIAFTAPVGGGVTLSCP